MTFNSPIMPNSCILQPQQRTRHLQYVHRAMVIDGTHPDYPGHLAEPAVRPAHLLLLVPRQHWTVVSSQYSLQVQQNTEQPTKFPAGFAR